VTPEDWEREIKDALSVPVEDSDFATRQEAEPLTMADILRAQHPKALPVRGTASVPHVSCPLCSLIRRLRRPRM
jgi:hypothetical protein